MQGSVLDERINQNKDYDYEYEYYWYLQSTKVEVKESIPHGANPINMKSFMKHPMLATSQPLIPDMNSSQAVCTFEHKTMGIRGSRSSSWKKTVIINRKKKKGNETRQKPRRIGGDI